MNTLIEISEQTVGQETVQTVNARELHVFLEVTSHFRDWIKNRIKEYNFQENQDFMSFAKILAKPKGGRSSMEYYLTLDMAKELAMVERNEKGKQARQYFIECEQRAKQIAAPCVDYSSPEAVLGVLTYLKSENERKDNVIAKLEPKAKALESLKRSDGLFGIIEAAKVLEMRPKDFIHYLWSHNWVYRRVPGAPLLPYQDKIKKGLMDCSTLTIHKPDGTEKIVSSAKITADGLASLREQFHGGVQ
ncbi:antA/AntB antirepressor family protein [Bartonella ancashensis]|uniref:Anti-repressor protein n=1 Tax=Bartonella ancashensis TaxID=1318743 RepID=A0A0M4L733_9HYPH|nr:antA/AntB antirepressor family protein [Bartonella ancashensis]ALE02888.1 Anti-repressor protein [Bartonella ancashensis]